MGVAAFDIRLHGAPLRAGDVLAVDPARQKLWGLKVPSTAPSPPPPPPPPPPLN